MANLKDFATGIVATAPSPATSGTSLVLQSGEGARFPAVPFYATAHPEDEVPTLDNAEKILVTNISTNTLTIVRAQGDTSAKSIAVGWRISNAIFAADVNAGLDPRLVVAASDAPQVWKDGADYLCDGTADNVQIQAAIDASEAGGGEVILSPGSFAIATGLTIVGNDDYTGPQVTLHGQGQEVTKLIGANNVDVITMSNSAKVNMQSFTIEVNGSGDALRSTDTGDLMRGFHFSMFKNLYILGDSSHTGWAMDLDNAFRSTFENIEIFDVDNGIRITATDSTFNPGDCTFTRLFIELNTNSGGVGLHLTSSVASVNQILFDMVELIDGGTGGTAILLNGAGSPNHNVFQGINIEQFATTINVTTGYGNVFDLNHVTPVTTFLTFGSDAPGNYVRRVGYLAVDTGTVAIINDANDWEDNPNTFENFYIGVASGATGTASVQNGTIIRGMKGYNDGTLAPILEPYSEGQQHASKGVILTDGATPALDASLGNIFRLETSGNRTIAPPTNPKPNQFIVIQHVAIGGARTLSLNTGTGGFAFGSDITALTATGSDLTDYIGCLYDAVDNKWRVISYVKGY